ncbi:MAG: hypothetical protein JWO88_3547, partial [Frankiales bacterium]|nr:hypothetical protein [Frankiales bacterium]
SLTAALVEAVKTFDDEEFAALRERAGVAWGHLAEAMGDQSGKALTLIAKTMWQTISQAMGQLTPAALSSIASQTDTAGPAETSSTSSPG